MTKDDTLKLALEAIEGVLDDSPKVLEASITGGLYEVVQCRDAITAIKEALAQPEQEPVAWMNDSTPSGIFARHMEGAKNFGCTIPLYKTPPQRTWVGLTDEDFLEACQIAERGNYLVAFQRIQNKLKAKNETN